MFTGMEVGGVHVNDMENSRVKYPETVFIALFIIVLGFLLGSLAIGVTHKPESISLTAGIMQGFVDLLVKFNISWLVPILGILVAFGAVGSVVAWIGGPSKGLLATAKEGALPPFLQYVNINEIQTHILWVQGGIVTILSMVFLLMPNVSAAFFLLSALTASLYLTMYALLFSAGIYLKFSQPDVKREFDVPGGKIGMCLVSGIGLIAVVFAIIVSFFPPSQLPIANPSFYTLT